jgi:hypothetical protein
MRNEIVHFTTTKQIKEMAKKMALNESRTLSQFADVALRELVKQRLAEEKKAV